MRAEATRLGTVEGHEAVVVPAGEVRLPGDLTRPAGPAGAVVFAHGSGSSRLSPRNAAVAAVLNRAGLATLLFDLLTEREAADRALVFDIPLLAGRLAAAARWLRAREPGLPLGYFGASTGAAAALWASTEEGAGASAIVSRGGRPDLAGARLPDVTAAVLLIVGSRDAHVLDLNREAMEGMSCPAELVVVPGASHLFEEPGALETVSDLAAGWFSRRLPGSGPEA